MRIGLPSLDQFDEEWVAQPHRPIRKSATQTTVEESYMRKDAMILDFRYFLGAFTCIPALGNCILPPTLALSTEYLIFGQLRAEMDCREACGAYVTSHYVALEIPWGCQQCGKALPLIFCFSAHLHLS